LTGAVVLTSVALVIGIPLGVWVSKTISDQLGNDMGWGPGLLEMAPATWLLAVVPIVLGAVLATALVPAALAGRIRVNEALRIE
jgi:ABC-type antimicrobial peptide transport system permease subunit